VGAPDQPRPPQGRSAVGVGGDRGRRRAIWDREAFPRLGEGDLDVQGVIDALGRIGYAGWLLVEQDTLPRTKERFERAATDQRANRQYLARFGL
jgi:inosose dehydratase